MGNGKCEDSEDPVKITNISIENIQEIACGAGNTLILTSTNLLYSWGFNSVGQLGLGHFKNKNMPCLINFEFGLITKIACGAGHCMVVNDKGNLFSWGCAGFYQTGHEKLEHSPSPQRIEFFQSFNVLDASCGIAHSLIVTNNEVYAFGDNVHYQCTGKEQYYKKPKKVELNGIIKVAAGGAHSLFLSSNHKIYACGLNSCGQVGTGSNKVISEPLKLKVTNVKTIYAGEEISAVLTHDNKVYV